MHQSSYRAFPWVLWKWSFIPLSALRLTRHPTAHSTAGISPEIHHRFAYPCLLPSPSPVTAVPSLCPTENVGWDGHRQAPVFEKLLVPQWTAQGIFWVAPCAAAALVGGESPGPRAQWCSSLTASVFRTKVFLPGIVRLRQGLRLPVLPVLFLVTEQKFCEFSAFWGKGLVLSRLRLVIPATLWLLAFFYFQNPIGILLTNPHLVFWVTLYLLNFKVGLALEKKKKAFPH